MGLLLRPDLPSMGGMSVRFCDNSVTVTAKGPGGYSVLYWARLAGLGLPPLPCVYDATSVGEKVLQRLIGYMVKA